MLCEKCMTIAEARSAFLIPRSIKQIAPLRTHSNIRNIDKYYTINCGMTNHNVKTCRKNNEHTIVATIEVT
jgi:hypothetical protein